MSSFANESGGTQPIRIMFVDDEALTRVGFRALLDAYAPRLQVVAEARSAVEALSMIDPNGVDVLLTDLRMQGNSHSGLELVAALRARCPDLPVIVVTGQNDDAMVLRVFKAQASGFVSKEGEPGEILRAIEAVHSGATYFPRNLPRLLDSEARKPTLSKREQEVCDLIALDMSSKEIARVLDIDYRTVDTHRGNAVTKLGKSGMELHRHCIEDLHARHPAWAKHDSKTKLAFILANHGADAAVIASRLGVEVHQVLDWLQA